MEQQRISSQVTKYFWKICFMEWCSQVAMMLLLLSDNILDICFIFNKLIKKISKLKECLKLQSYKLIRTVKNKLSFLRNNQCKTLLNKWTKFLRIYNWQTLLLQIVMAFLIHLITQLRVTSQFYRIIAFRSLNFNKLF